MVREKMKKRRERKQYYLPLLITIMSLPLGGEGTYLATLCSLAPITIDSHSSIDGLDFGSGLRIRVGLERH